MFMLDLNFSVKKEGEKDNSAKFVITPLTQGYGHTLGNSLRRVLLTSLKGAAAVSVRIDGVKHQFSTIPGLKEDIVQLILNLKQVRFRLNSQKEATVVLSAKGPKKIYAKELKSSNCEIINKDQYLGELTKKTAKLDLEIQVKEGTGYVSADERESKKTLGEIVIDSLFSPVVSVSYKVEATRVGRVTDLDKLILEIETDGTITPHDALKRASQILINYFQQVYEPKVKTKKDVAVTPTMREEVLKMSLEELDMPTRIINALRNEGIDTVGQLLGTSKKDLMKIKNIGSKSIAVIEKKLKRKEIADKIE